MHILYRLNWVRRTSWGWWDDWDDTVLQTQDSKFEPWRSEAEHATSWSRRLPTILTFTRGWGGNIFCIFQTAETGNRTPSSGVKGSGANHYPRALVATTSWAQWVPTLDLAWQTVSLTTAPAPALVSTLPIEWRYIPANMGHSPNAVSMLGQRRRRWANIDTALGEFPMFLGEARRHTLHRIGQGTWVTAGLTIRVCWVLGSDDNGS